MPWCGRRCSICGGAGEIADDGEGQDICAKSPGTGIDHGPSLAEQIGKCVAGQHGEEGAEKKNRCDPDAETGAGSLPCTPAQVEHIDRQWQQLSRKGDGEESEHDNHTQGVVL